jgi:hypothetical protein
MGAFLEVRIPEELGNWLTKQSEQLKVKTPHARPTCGAPAALCQTMPNDYSEV